MMHQAIKARQNSRQMDIAQSQDLLLELATSEPTILQCFKIIESTCLSQGIFCKIEDQHASERFQRFIDEHYLPFCKASIRAMFIYGFVPWRLRKLVRGDSVPEVMPPGTFNWNTELGAVEQDRAPRQKQPRKAKSIYEDDDSRLVVYRVTPLAGGIKEEDVNVYISTPPCLNISINSNILATVPSPLAHLLCDYKNLREAQIRRSHADSWNTTARVISTFKPNLRVEDNPSQYLMDFVHENFYDKNPMGASMFPPLEAHNVWQREHIMRRQFMETPSNHHPEVYALPRDHEMTPQAMLTPCEDLTFLLDKYRRDVSALMGVPHEMIIGRDNGNHETVRKTIASGRIFSTNMHEICRHVQILMKKVYCVVYRANPETVEFTLIPMPRLEIETIQDFKILYEIGALTPDMSVNLSRILLGEEPHSKKQRVHKEKNSGVKDQVQAETHTAPGAAKGKPGKESLPPQRSTV